MEVLSVVALIYKLYHSLNVTIIGSGAFSHCGNLTSISIPESVISIGEWIFYNCNKLVYVSFPANTKSIRRWFFYNMKV